MILRSEVARSSNEVKKEDDQDSSDEDCQLRESEALQAFERREQRDLQRRNKLIEAIKNTSNLNARSRESLIEIQQQDLRDFIEKVN